MIQLPKKQLEGFSEHSVRDFSEFQKRIKYGVASTQSPLDLPPVYYPTSPNHVPNRFVKPLYVQKLIPHDYNQSLSPKCQSPRGTCTQTYRNSLQCKYNEINNRISKLKSDGLWEKISMKEYVYYKKMSISGYSRTEVLIQMKTINQSSITSVEDNNNNNNNNFNITISCKGRDAYLMYQLAINPNEFQKYNIPQNKQEEEEGEGELSESYLNEVSEYIFNNISLENDKSGKKYVYLPKSVVPKSTTKSLNPSNNSSTVSTQKQQEDSIKSLSPRRKSPSPRSLRIKDPKSFKIHKEKQFDFTSDPECKEERWKTITNMYSPKSPKSPRSPKHK